jgi:hypothetical protein
MLKILKKKIIIENKPELYHCSVCKGNYDKKEDLDFWVSRRLNKDICKRCAEYIGSK